MAKFALGKLAWPPDVAMQTDVNLILIAREGSEEADHRQAQIIFAAQGITLPPLDQPKPEPITASGLKAWAKDHNARMAASEKNRNRAQKLRDEAATRTAAKAKAGNPAKPE